NLTLGYSVPMLPLQYSARIIAGNALRTNWTDLLTPGTGTIVMGNPPFLGHYTRSSEQAQELRDVWQRKDIGHLDYVTGWYRKALDFFGNALGRFAFVSTNSVTQGEPVSALFGPIFEAGWRIRFAHRTFAWTSEAPGAAAVHCVIIGFDRDTKPAPRLFTYARPKSRPEEIATSTINGNLVDGPRVGITSRRAPLSSVIPPVQFGSMPNDGGHLLVGKADHAEVAEDPVATKYLRRFVGARELLHDAPRWCLWMEELDPSDPGRSELLRGRLEAVRDYRSASRRAATNKLADTPALFGERRQPNVPFDCIPAHFSESRRFATVEHLEPTVIAGNANFTAEDPSGFLFGIVSSSMFIAWQRATGGRIKSDLRFSATVVWNNLPLPEVTEKQRDQVIAGGKAVLEARALHPERSLAQHYAPLAMDPALLK